MAGKGDHAVPTVLTWFHLIRKGADLDVLVYSIGTYLKISSTDTHGYDTYSTSVHRDFK